MRAKDRPALKSQVAQAVVSIPQGWCFLQHPWCRNRGCGSVCPPAHTQHTAQLSVLPGSWYQGLLPSLWDGHPSPPQKEASFQLREAQRWFLGGPVSAAKQELQWQEELPLLLWGCCAIIRSSMARSALYPSWVRHC